MTATIAIGIIALLLVASFAFGVKTVRPFERGLVERFGRYRTTLNPGMRFVLPIIDRLIRVDMRERVADIPPQDVMTKDHIMVAIDIVVFYEVSDPRRLVYSVKNFLFALSKLTQSSMQGIVADMNLEQVLAAREQIAGRIRDILDDATDKWGTRVVRVEIEHIDPPDDAMELLQSRMNAEKERRTAISEARSAREAAVLRASGEKQAAVLAAEGRRESQLIAAEAEARSTQLAAEAEARRQAVVAQGEAEAIRAVYQAVQPNHPANEILTLKYREAAAQAEAQVQFRDGAPTNYTLSQMPTPAPASSSAPAPAGMQPVDLREEGALATNPYAEEIAKLSSFMRQAQQNINQPRASYDDDYDSN